MRKNVLGTRDGAAEARATREHQGRGGAPRAGHESGACRLLPGHEKWGPMEGTEQGNECQRHTRPLVCCVESRARPAAGGSQEAPRKSRERRRGLELGEGRGVARCAQTQEG